MTTRLVRATTAARAAMVDTAGMEAATAAGMGVGAAAEMEAAEVTAEAAGMADIRDSLTGLGYLPHRDDPEMAN